MVFLSRNQECPFWSSCSCPVYTRPPFFNPGSYMFSSGSRQSVSDRRTSDGSRPLLGHAFIAKLARSILERIGCWISPGSQAAARWERAMRNRKRWPSPRATKKRARARVDRQAAKREGSEADHRGTDARASWLGELFGPGDANREFNKMDLHRLMGSVRYPTQATPRRSSLSRVPENGTHGLKGAIRNGPA